MDKSILKFGWLQPAWMETTVNGFLEVSLQLIIMLYRSAFGHTETGKAIQALARNMKKALQKLHNIYLQWSQEIIF